ncbi:MAG: hypothetical protein Q7S82_00825 [bacterium]|nr:hypothetical protein [bacterium]
MIQKFFLILGIVATLVMAVLLIGVYKLPLPPASELQKENSFIFTAEYSKDNFEVIEVAHIDKPGYVVVHENNNGTPGEVLGVSGLITGTNYDIEIPIDSRQSTTSVITKLYYDNGDSVFDVKSDVPVESDSATIIGPVVGPSVSPGVFTGNLQQFEPFRVNATILDIYTINDDGVKKMGKIRINNILEQCGSAVWECKTKISAGDVLDVYFQQGTVVGSQCPPEGSAAPCSIGYSVGKGDQIEAGLQINIEDSSYKKNTIFVIRKIE